MKVSIYFYVVSLLLVSNCVRADLALELKLGRWQAEYSGDIGVDERTVTFDELGYDDFDQGTFMATLRHPVPIVPNVRVQSVDLDADGEGVISRDFELGDITFTASESVTSTVDLSYQDVVLFYSPLSNIATVDIGLAARYIDGSINAIGSITSIETNVDFDGWLPMLHGAARFELPLTGVYVDFMGNIVSYDGNSISDFTAALGYALDLTAFDIIVELGGRWFTLDAEDIDDVDDQDADVDIDGLYLNVGLKF